MPNLNRLRVVDLTRLLPGPYCTFLLGKLGADVIKIESLIAGDPIRLMPPFVAGQSLWFTAVNQNKRSLALNIRKPRGKEILRALLATADVVVESFKPGKAASLGFGYEAVRSTNEGVVYCSLTGYGQAGERSQRSGHDINFLALSGVLDLMRAGDGQPIVPGVQLADIAGGSLSAVISILAALVERGVTGKGQYLDASALEGTKRLMPLQRAIQAAGHDGDETLTYLSGTMPGYNVYETADGHYMSLGAIEPVLWTGFCKAVGREDLIPFHVPRPQDRAWALAEVAAVFRQRSRDEWEDFFRTRDLCCEPVLLMREVVDRGGPESAPRLGEHTQEILLELGYTPQSISALRSERVVALPDDTSARRVKALNV